jgi:LysR family transcriptional regulator, low CO2-responsive transcriptional regulator
MSYAQFKAFHAVAASGGFSKAAARMNLSQPAVSDHVRKLEAAYGVELFLRTRRKVELTDLGRQLFAVTERQFEAEAQALELLNRAQGLEQGLISIGADAAVHALPLVKKFNQRFPGVKLKLITGNSARLTDALERLEIDFAIVAETPASELFLSRKIREDRLVCLLAHGHSLARRKSLRFAELIEGPLIIREKGSVTRALLEAEIGRRSSQHARLIEIEGREAANEAVAQGLGLGIISRGELSRDPRLHVVPISDWHQTMSEWLVCLKARSDLHIMKAFLDLLN